MQNNLYTADQSRFKLGQKLLAPETASSKSTRRYNMQAINLHFHIKLNYNNANTSHYEKNNAGQRGGSHPQNDEFYIQCPLLIIADPAHHETTPDRHDPLLTPREPERTHCHNSWHRQKCVPSQGRYSDHSARLRRGKRDVLWSQSFAEFDHTSNSNPRR